MKKKNQTNSRSHHVKVRVVCVCFLHIECVSFNGDENTKKKPEDNEEREQDDDDKLKKNQRTLDKECLWGEKYVSILISFCH